MSKKHVWPIFIFVQLFLLMNEPYALRWFLPFPELRVTGVVFLALLFFLTLRFKGNGLPLPSKFNNAIIVTSFAWGLYGIGFQDSSYFTRIVLLLITYYLLLLLYRNEIFDEFWKYNNRFILLQSLFSLVGFVLLAAGILQPLLTVLPADSFHVYRFYGILCSKVGGSDFVRPAGYFDEAGALAAWVVYGLIFNYAFIKDGLYRKYTPWFTTVTLSLAFYIQMALYLAFENIKSIYRLFPIVLVILIAIPYVNNTEGSDFDIYSRTIGRFELDSETGIAGNNRQDQMDKAYSIFERYPVFGIGSQNLGRQEDRVSDNPYEVLAKDGIVGFIITYLPLFLIVLNNRRKEVVFGLLVVFVGYQQRPFHYNFMQDLYLWSFLLFALLDKKRKLKFV